MSDFEVLFGQYLTDVVTAENAKPPWATLPCTGGSLSALLEGLLEKKAKLPRISELTCPSERIF